MHGIVFPRAGDLLVGVPALLLVILTEAHSHKQSRRGRSNKLRISEMFMMALEYLREYRTYFHIGASYGLSESNAYQSQRCHRRRKPRGDCHQLPDNQRRLDLGASWADRVGNPEAESIYVVYDNASYYHSRKMREYLSPSRISLVFCLRILPTSTS